ncbi:calcium-binding protein [Rhizobium sp. S-51]|uniref:Calcium-binding protein n=1 Tax=Rhizobium terricola TaxID=2728849 RepID=A0A7Y0AX45_9HYPH|nr:calcium-binding protein [Rhizobium terricola]NML75051.1 calcium-binding protein [Rhizobium terricola]
MTGKKLTIAAIIGSLMIGTSASAVLARQEMGRGPGGGPDGIFVRMLQNFDSNKDGKIAKVEATAAGEKIFASIDENTDGSLTPGEFRKHRDMREQRKAEREANAAGQGNGPGQGPQDGSGPQDGQPPRDGRGKQFGWNWGFGGGRGGHHGWGGNGPDGNDGPRHGKHHGEDHAMRDGRGPEMGPDMGPGGPMDGRMGGHGPRGIIRVADADENGQITKAEASALIDKMFTQLDTNKDGAISADDLPKRGFGFL